MPMPGSSESHIRICAHCLTPYDWRRSPSSSLKMTYCGSLCERAGLGFTLETIIGRAPERPRWLDDARAA